MKALSRNVPKTIIIIKDDNNFVHKEKEVAEILARNFQ